MAESHTPSANRRHLVAGCVLALIVGGLSPLLDVFALYFLAVPVFLAFLYAYAGMIPAALCAAVTLFSALWNFGAVGCAMTLAALVLPAGVILWGIRARAPFHTQLARAIAAFTVGVVASLAIAYAAIGSDILGALMDSLKNWLETASKSAPGLIDWVLGRTYDLPDTPVTLTQEIWRTGFLSEAQRADSLAQYVSDMHAMLALTLPGILLRAAAFSGLFAVAWPGRVLRDSIPEDSPARLPLYKWHTPYQITLGLLATLGVSYLLSWQDVPGGDTATMTLSALLVACFQIQAVVSAERRLRAIGMRPGRRAALIIVSLLVLGEYVAVYGGASALVGTTGALRQILTKRSEKN